MQEIPTAFTPLRLSALVSDYLLNHPALREFHSGVPDINSLVEAHANRTMDAGVRNVLVTTLRKQYEGIVHTEKTEANIGKLLLADTSTITTGHQLCLATGPLYVMYKIASTIALAARLSAEVKSGAVVPVLWLASEDHDVEEINHAWIGKERITWNAPLRHPVGTLPTEGLREALDGLCELLQPSALRDEIRTLLADCATNVTTYAQSFRKLIHALFGAEGLVIIDASDASLKQLFVPVMTRELREGIAQQVVTSTNKKLLAAGYSPQVNPRSVNLFTLSPDQRQRLDRNEEGMIAEVDGIRSGTAEEWVKQCENRPESLSPNVLLRPVYQESILPNIAVIGGPGEIAYWLQLAELFRALNVSFPALVLRDSFLLLQQKHLQRFDKLGLTTSDILKSRVELEKHFAEAAGMTDLEAEKELVRNLFEALSKKAAAIDPTLEAAALAEGQRQQDALTGFSKRMTKAAKARESQRIEQMHKLLDELLPDDGPQERHDNYFDHVAKAGRWFHRELIAACDPMDTRMKVIALSQPPR
jgi:bacillithiol biosynthesis cysteine-adding enzyme BshC